MEAAGHGSGAGRSEALLDDTSPHPARCAELGYLLEQLAPAGEEEAESIGEVVDVETGERRRVTRSATIPEGTR